MPAFYTDIALRLRTGVTQPAVQFSSSSYNVGADQGSVTLTVYRLGRAREPSGQLPHERRVGCRGEGLHSGGITFKWPANDVSPRTIEVPLLYTNKILQANRQFLVSLSNPAGGAMLGAANAALVMLLNPVVNSAVFDSANYAVPKAAANAIFTLNRFSETATAR